MESNAIDSNLATSFASATKSGLHWLQIDFGAYVQVNILIWGVFISLISVFMTTASMQVGYWKLSD